MSDWRTLDKELTRACNEHGWSYSSYHEDPLLLVGGLFLKIKQQEEEVSKADLTRIEWLDELSNLVRHAACEHSDDPFETVKTLVAQSIEQRSHQLCRKLNTETAAAPVTLTVAFKGLSNAEVAAFAHGALAELQARASEP